MARRALAAAALAMAALAFGAAPAAGQGMVLAPFGQHAFNNPYYVTAPPGQAHDVMVVEGEGRIWLVRDGVTLPTPFLDIKPLVLQLGEEGCPECGIYSIAFAPDYATSGLFYVQYSRDLPPADGEFALRLDEFRRSASNPDVADPASRRTVMDIPRESGHYGGQLQFGPDGYLYLSLGDGHIPEQAQDLTSTRGKILRIDPHGAADGEYSIPPGNPFADGTGPNVDEIYSYGMRNPYRFSFDRATGDLTIGEVGEHTWEEVEYAQEGTGVGANYGWPCFEGVDPFPLAPPSCTPPPAQTPPAFQYHHPAMGSSGITGGYVVRDPSLPSLYGRYVYSDSGDNGAGAIRSLRLQPGGAVEDAPTGLAEPFIPSFGEDACGHIYAMSLTTDSLYRIEPADGNLQCKLAPALTVSGSTANRAARSGGIVLQATCDEDCNLRASGSIRVKRGKRGRGFTIAAAPYSGSLELNKPTTVTLALTRKAKRKLKRALRDGRRAIANYEASARGGGGGTDAVSGSVRQRR